jgi:ABC-type nickel/cobalt efflux system permease component RcnA
MIAVSAGLVAGFLHVLSGPDHLAAVAPLTFNNWRKALAIGFRWGIGHSSGVLFLGLLALLSREMLPIDVLSGWAERFVGVLLVGIGLWGLRKALKTRVHAHQHTHDGTTHTHIHVHGHAHHPEAASTPHQHTHAAFVVGTVHGLAGGSHLINVLPATVFKTTNESITYLCSYGIGTILAMIAFSYGLALLTSRVERESVGYRFMASAISAFAVILGVYWMVA